MSAKRSRMPGEARVLSLPRGVRGPDAYLSVSSVAPSGLRLLEEAVVLCP